MNKEKLFIFVFFFTTIFSFITGFPENKEKLHEISTTPKCEDGENCQEEDELPEAPRALDSHEAMNTGPQRPKRSLDLEKRLFRNMILGAMRNKKQMVEAIQDDNLLQTDASELLLELMVRIAAHPQQWNQVHQLLQKIDNDLIASKKLLNDLEIEKDEDVISTSMPSTSTTTTTTTEVPTTITSTTEVTTVSDVQRLIILLDGEEDSRNKNHSRKWPKLDDNDTYETSTEKNTENVYPWNKHIKNTISKEKEFTFHRVTGKPLPYRSNQIDKGSNMKPSAYVAVSAISQDTNKDALLEDELRRLKPWNHQDNLNRMETLRKKWFLQSNGEQK